jgi:hypothetical protein
MLRLHDPEVPTMKLFDRDETTPHARARWARSISRLAHELARPHPPLRDPNRVYRLDVAAASLPSLIEIEHVLTDETAAVRPEAMHRLREYLTDGGSSPLYRDDPEAARRAAHELEVAFTVPAHA